MKWLALLELYSTLRRAGHTSAAARTAKACGGIVLCATAIDAQEITRTMDADAVSIADPDRLRGRNRALIPDNHLMMVMLNDLVALQRQAARDQEVIFELDQEKARLRLESFYVRAAQQMLAILLEEAQLRGAFRALAEIGLAVAGGEALVFIAQRGRGYHSPGFLRSKGGSCDACTEARVIARRVHELLGVEP